MAGNHAQDGGLAAAGRADEAAISAVGNPEIDAVDGIDDTVIALADTCELNIASFDPHPSKPYPLIFCAPRFFWISTMLPRLTPMTTKDTIVVTVPSA